MSQRKLGLIFQRLQNLGMLEAHKGIPAGRHRGLRYQSASKPWGQGGMWLVDLPREASANAAYPRKPLQLACPCWGTMPI